MCRDQRHLTVSSLIYPLHQLSYNCLLDHWRKMALRPTSSTTFAKGRVDNAFRIDWYLMGPTVVRDNTLLVSLRTRCHLEHPDPP